MEFSEELFRHPPALYRSKPFWAWNGRLERERLVEQVGRIHEMGYGGFCIHSRIGLETEYLGTEFLDCVRACRERARSLGMETWLYDEDKWPSGYGAGRVTKKEEYRAQYLLLTPVFYKEGSVRHAGTEETRITADGRVELAARYEIKLTGGRLAWYRRCPDRETSDKAAGEQGGIRQWYAYRVTVAGQPWFNNAAYVDVLNPDAIKRFLEVSYEPYAGLFGGTFPGDVPGIFTDEPQMTGWRRRQERTGRESAGGMGDTELLEMSVPYSGCLLDLYREGCAKELFDILPEVFFDPADGGFSRYRWLYFRMLAEQFNRSYAGVIGAWCGAHGLALTGHLMSEDTLEGQSRMSGEAMLSYFHYQLPGVDILADRREYTTLKQVQSAAGQCGKPGVACELYGVTNWDFSFAEKKRQGDWLAALGVTYRIPHLMWYTMGGEAKRDYPAPLDFHSPWYQANPVLEAYFARLAVALRRGKRIVRIAVLHPVESEWLLFDWQGKNRECERRLEEQFQSLARALLSAQLDFDYLSEALLEELVAQRQEDYNEEKKGPDGNRDGQTSDGCTDFSVGEMAYSVVVVPELVTVRSSTLARLEAFRGKGGDVVFLGEPPRCVDAACSDRAGRLAGQCRRAEDEAGLIQMLEPYREIRLTEEGGRQADDFLYQMREDGRERWLFLSGWHLQEKKNDGAAEALRAVSARQGGRRMRLRIAGVWKVILYDAMDGCTREFSARTEGGWTCMPVQLYEHDSVLLRLLPGTAPQNSADREDFALRCVQEERFPSAVRYQLQEPNILLLDCMEYSFDKGAWQAAEEILRIDDKVRDMLELCRRTDSLPQPWLVRADGGKTYGLLRMRCSIRSELALECVSLVWEGEPDVQIFWNGQSRRADRSVSQNGCGSFYLDSCLHRMTLHGLHTGINTLELHIPFRDRTNLEWCYLLGDFGVALKRPSEPYLTRLPDTLSFGDQTVQGFPFYGGNLIYETDFRTKSGLAELELAPYHAPLAAVAVDDAVFCPVFTAPYRVRLGWISEGKHTFRVLCYGSRRNQFGQVHNCGPGTQYYGPYSWRTKGKLWSDDYVLSPCGVYERPVLRIYAGDGETAFF